MSCWGAAPALDELVARGARLSLCGNQPVSRVHPIILLSHFLTMTRLCWLCRAGHCHAIEQASRRWRRLRRERAVKF